MPVTNCYLPPICKRGAFAKKLGYSGFPQLKIELAKDLVGSIPEVDNSLHPDEDMATLMNKVHHSQIVTIDKTYHLLSASTLEDVVKAGGRISLLDLANAMQAEKKEKKNSVVEKLKTKPLKEKEKQKKAPQIGAEMER